MNCNQAALNCKCLHIVPFYSEWSYAPRPRRAARIGYVALLIASLAASLSAQAVPGNNYDDPCLDKALLPMRKCKPEDQVRVKVKPENEKKGRAIPPEGTLENVSDGAKTALECEWMGPSDQVLAAFKLLISGSKPDLSAKVLNELKKGLDPKDPNFLFDQGFLQAAMGDPDTDDKSNGYGQLRSSGLQNFLDLLAKANRIVGEGKNSDGSDDVDADEQKVRLFKCTKDRIDDIFNAVCDGNGICDTGPSALERVNDAFTNKNNYVGFYELLVAALQQSKEDDLEKFRAAFSVDASLLAKQVAAKIAAAKN
jgi:hypothetical protein